MTVQAAPGDVTRGERSEVADQRLQVVPAGHHNLGAGGAEGDTRDARGRRRDRDGHGAET
jgi:hypothetical protein